MEESSQRITLNQSKKEIQSVLNLLDLKLIRNPLKKSVMHSQLIHSDLVKNFKFLGVPMHMLVWFRMVEDMNYDNLVSFYASYAAEEFNTDTPHISKCVKRLEKKYFAIRLWDPANEKRRVRLWMLNPNIIFRGPGSEHQRAVDNFVALLEGRYEDTTFDRDRSQSGEIRRGIPWLQGKLDLMMDDSKDVKDESERGTGSAG